MPRCLLARATARGSKCAISKTTRVVAAVTLDDCPPMTPAIATGPAASAMMSVPGSSSAQYAVQRDNGLAGQGLPYDDAMLLKAVVVECVSRLSVLFQAEIGHVDNATDRAHAQLVELSPESMTRRAGDDVLHQDTDVGTAQDLRLRRSRPGHRHSERAEGLRAAAA